MTNDIPIGETRSIRECDFDEYWLHEQIAENPGCLNLGELEVVSRERRQSSGGKLDILLKDPQDDSMYEVEVMLGDTDESHIIRTIEYWDNEKRKWPQRQHYAVLVAEYITRRFFNVIQLLSQSIPIIAIQVNIVEADNKKLLHFSKILDTYEEPEDDLSLSNEKYDEGYWKNRSSWTLEAAKALLDVVRPVYPNAVLNYVKYYIAIEVSNNNYMWFHKRSNGNSLLSLWFSESLLPQALKIFDEAKLSYVQKNQSLKLTTNKQMIETNADSFREIAKLVQESWNN